MQLCVDCASGPPTWSISTYLDVTMSLVMGMPSLARCSWRTWLSESCRRQWRHNLPACWQHPGPSNSIQKLYDFIHYYDLHVICIRYVSALTQRQFFLIQVHRQHCKKKYQERNHRFIEKGDRSTHCALPSIISSAIARPLPGPLRIPQQPCPVATKAPESPGTGPSSGTLSALIGR